MTFRSKQKILSSILILSVLALSSLVAIPFAHGQSSASTSIPSSPALNSITLTSYGGDDASGVADLVAGKIQAYDFAVTPTEASTIPTTGFSEYVSPASWYGLEINPTNTSDGFNPFQFQQVRFALNYLVNRNYFVSNLLGGEGIPTVSVYGGEPDQLVTSTATAPYSNITNSISIANASIYTTLIANGATFKWSAGAASTEWYYHGQPIVISIFNRTDDPVRDQYDGYLASQLEAVGFQVTLIPGTLSEALTAVFGTDPANATWDIYPASYGAVYSYYDEGFAELYAPIAGAIPASSNLGPAFGTYNDTADEQPGTVALLNTADQYALDFFNTNFTSLAQRDADLNDLTSAGIQAAVVIGIATSLAPYVASNSLTGISANFVEDPILNGLNFLTMDTSTGTANIGVRYLAQSSLNPVGGWNDAYSAAWSEATGFAPIQYQPSTGYTYPAGWSFSVQDNDPTADVPVPSTAVVMNASADDFMNVPSGTMAKSAVIVNLAPMLSEEWQDGQPVTIADVLYQYILAGEVTQNTNSSVFDGYSSAVFGPGWQTLLGMQIVNSTAIEVYSTFYYPDSYYSGLNAASELWALSPSTRATGQLPWEVYAGMANLVATGKDAWSSSTATADNLPWLSLVNPTDVANMETAMTAYASSSYIPSDLQSLEKLTGVTLVTPAQAAAGYTAAVNFMKQYGNGVISNGPYILTDYSASTSPAYMTLTKFSAFNWGNQMDPNLGTPSILLNQQATIPGVLSPGQTITVTAVQTVDGSTTTSPSPGATVTLQLISNGAIAYQTNATSSSSGTVTFTIPSSLPTGQYILSLWTANSASTLYDPLTQTIVLQAATTSTTTTSSTTTSTTTSSTTTTTSSTTTSTTSSSSSTTALSPMVLGGVAVSAAVIAAALALGSSRRRGYPGSSARQASL